MYCDKIIYGDKKFCKPDHEHLYYKYKEEKDELEEFRHWKAERENAVLQEKINQAKKEGEAGCWRACGCAILLLFILAILSSK